MQISTPLPYSSEFWIINISLPKVGNTNPEWDIPYKTKYNVPWTWFETGPFVIGYYQPQNHVLPQFLITCNGTCYICEIWGKDTEAFLGFLEALQKPEELPLYVNYPFAQKAIEAYFRTVNNASY